MADDSGSEKPRRRRRRRGRDPEGAETPPPPEATRPEGETGSQSETTRVASAADDAPQQPEAEEVEPTTEDVQAEEAAADVVLEADAEAEGESSLPESDDSEDEDVEEHEAEEAELDADEEEPDAEADEEEPAAEAPRPARRRRRGAAAEEPPPAPAPARRRRSQRDPNLPPPVVRAQAKYVRSSARKARLVCDHIRGKSVEDARAILALTPRAIARDWSKLLESAVANAEHNHELVGEDLYVKAIHADEGPTIKRFRPRAMGRATRIRKRTSHLTILLTPKE